MARAPGCISMEQTQHSQGASSSGWLHCATSSLLSTHQGCTVMALILLARQPNRFAVVPSSQRVCRYTTSQLRRPSFLTWTFGKHTQIYTVLPNAISKKDLKQPRNLCVSMLNLKKSGMLWSDVIGKREYNLMAIHWGNLASRVFSDPSLQPCVSDMDALLSWIG